MSCDEIIELLLEEDSSNTEQLESHLAVCKRCSSLREVLSPLTGFEETEETRDSIQFPTKNSASPEALLIAKESANKLQKQAPKSVASRQSSSSSLKYAAAFLAGVAASLGGFAVLRSEPIQPANAHRTACLWETEFDQQQKESEFVRSCVACHLVSN